MLLLPDGSEYRDFIASLTNEQRKQLPGFASLVTVNVIQNFHTQITKAIVESRLEGVAFEDEVGEYVRVVFRNILKHIKKPE